MSQLPAHTRSVYPSERPFIRGTLPPGRRPPPVDPLTGKRHSQRALAFGVLSLFLSPLVLFPLVFGPLALRQAKKSERFGEPANGGRLLAWVGLLIGALSTAMFILFFSYFYSLATAAELPVPLMP